MYQEQRIRNLIDRLNNENDRESSLDIAINLANELLNTLGAPEDRLKNPNKALEEAYPFSYFPNQKMETWFEKHRFYDDARTAFKLFDDDKSVYESSFYWMNESSTKGRIAATSLLGSNWEDSELTMKPEYKIGIDFYLNHDANSLLMVVSKKGNVRVIEFSENLTHTQKEILDSLKNVFNLPGIDLSDPCEPQKSIHFKLWSTLQLNEVNKKFYAGIADLFEELSSFLGKVYITKTKKDLQLFSSRLIGRILFVWFLRKKSIINIEIDYFNIGSNSSTEYYDIILKNLFFKTLNTPIEERSFNDKKTPFLNGGLFEVHDNDYFNEVIKFPDNYFDRLYNHLNSFNFTVDESTPQYEQIAIDPEMLGRVFENLLASIVPETSSTANERKNKGAFYTPREIVSYMCRQSIKGYIKKIVNDPSMSSGIDKLIDLNDASFLKLKSTGGADLWGVRSKKVQERIISILNDIRIFDPACGSGAFPMGMLQLISQTYLRLTAKFDSKQQEHIYASGRANYNKYESKLSIIKNNLYGSDIEPMAIEIARLRCWLSLIIEESTNVEPLPNLDFNFVCSNTLVKLEEKELVLDLGGNEIFEKEFSDLRTKYFNAHVKDEKNEIRARFTNLYKSHFDNGLHTNRVEQLKTWNPFDITVPSDFFDPNTMFNIEKFDIVIANPPYVSVKNIAISTKKTLNNLFYSANGRFNLFELFIEKSIDLLKDNGILTFIIPEQIYSNYDYRFIREIIKSSTTVNEVILFSNKVFDAAVDTTILILSKDDLALKIKVGSDLDDNKFLLPQEELGNYPFSIFPVLLDYKYRNVINKMNKLSDFILGSLVEIQQGIIYTGQKKADIFSNEKLNKSYKKSLDGRDIHKYRIDWNSKENNKYLKYTNDLHRPREERIFLANPKIVFPRKSRLLTCALDYEQYYALNTAYVLLSTKVELEYIIALINSDLMQFYYSGLFLGWQITIPAMESMPIIIAEEEIRNKVIHIVRELSIGNHSKTKENDMLIEINNLVYDIYNLSIAEIQNVKEFLLK